MCAVNFGKNLRESLSVIFKTSSLIRGFLYRYKFRSICSRKHAINSFALVKFLFLLFWNGFTCNFTFFPPIFAIAPLIVLIWGLEICSKIHNFSFALNHFCFYYYKYFYCSISHQYCAIHLFEVNNKTPEKGLKYVQSWK